MTSPLITHVEVTFALGRRVLMSVAAYAALSTEALAGTRVKALGRADVIARLAKARRS